MSTKLNDWFIITVNIYKLLYPNVITFTVNQSALRALHPAVVLARLRDHVSCLGLEPD